MKFYFNQVGNNRFAARQTVKNNQIISSEDTLKNALLDDLRKTKEALETAYIGFDNVVEPDLIDSYIYELNAVISRYNYLLEQVGKLNNKEKPVLNNSLIPVLGEQGDEVPLYSELTGNLAMHAD